MTDQKKSFSANATKRQYAQRKQHHEVHPETLHEEIAMLRILMRRVMSMADEGHPLPDLLRLLDCVSKVCTRLSTLLKAERLPDDRQDVASALNQALSEVIDEFDAGSH